ncbi:MAG: NifB/NifX family molybdenum-iron cluster-binding protein [Methanomassiliicoccaceae archaeon]|jgi:predicted Fe-Mo cluster-binding NifX family protein|nr:NifB/NifX family molybdenum-iron cluster-binding protein [Methanomassiliicoccaceae archaeon]
MRACVLADGDSLSSYVADDFGHAPYMIVVDMETLEFEAKKNEFVNAVGAGMKVADAIVALGVNVVITGGIGPHGYDRLTGAGITVSYDEDGTVGDCVRNVKRRLERMSK